MHAPMGLAAVRARSAHDALEYVERNEPSLLPKILAHLPASTVDAIQTTPKTGWIPMEQDRWLARAWGELFGPDKGKQLIRGSVLTILDSPLYAPLIRPGLRLLGATPGTLAKIFPRAFTLTYRNVCTPTLGQKQSHLAQLHFTEMSEEFLDAVENVVEA